MSTLKKVTIDVPAQLFEAGLTEAQIQAQVKRWLVVWLWQEDKITVAQASQLLTTDQDGLEAILAAMEISPEGIKESKGGVSEQSPGLLQPASDGQPGHSESELSQARQELAEVRQHLGEVERLQSEFLATVSHELRTPLNSILGFAKLLLNQTVGPLNQIQQTDISYIYDSAQHLLSLVNDILDLSKIKAGKIRLDMEWLTVEEIIVGVMASTYILIDDKPIELKEEIEPRLPRIYVDRGRIRQVVINLLSNAAKFTEAGRITLRIYRTIKEDQEFICFSVSDTGIGIAEEDMAKVFEAFRQVDSSEARRAQGTGLGMPISRQLVELHGGELWLESKLGQGSTFSFTIPLQPPQSVEADVVHVDYSLKE